MVIFDACMHEMLDDDPISMVAPIISIAYPPLRPASGKLGKSQEEDQDRGRIQLLSLLRFSTRAQLWVLTAILPSVSGRRLFAYVCTPM